MPKDRRLNLLSSHRARASPYACSSSDSSHDKLEGSLPPIGDEKEWEEARCPICMEHPHNAVLLLCSSGDKGCRPYMCDTSIRHSNCLDQFRKSVAGASSIDLQEDVTGARMHYPRGRVEQTLLRPTRSMGEQMPGLLCPLCRGQITWWVVAENARCYMNTKVRSCSLESCNFSGNYTELRKHARREHPTVKPSDVDPGRQSEWARLERERDLGDTLSVIHSIEHYSPSDMSLDWTSDGSSSDDNTELEWSDISDISVDLDVGFDFTFSFLNEFPFGPSDLARNTSSARTGDRLLNRRSMRSRSIANHRSGVTSSRWNRSQGRLGLEGVRNIGSERNGSRLLNRRSRSRSGSEGVETIGSERNGSRLLNRRSRSRSNGPVEITLTERRDATPSRSGPVGTGSERTGGRPLGRRSIRSRWRSNHQVEIIPPRRLDRVPSSLGSGWARNTGTSRTSDSSLAGTSMASRSRSDHQLEATYRRQNTSSSGSGSQRYAE